MIPANHGNRCAASVRSGFSIDESSWEPIQAAFRGQRGIHRHLVCSARAVLSFGKLLDKSVQVESMVFVIGPGDPC